MAAIPATLQGNYVSVQGAYSVQNMVSNDGVQFGLITSVYTGVFYLKVGDSVMFKSKDGIAVSKGVDSYFLVKETDIILVETPPA